MTGVATHRIRSDAALSEFEAVDAFGAIMSKARGR